VEAKHFALRKSDESSRSMTLREALDETIPKIFAGHAKLPGLPTGYHDIDQMTSGFRAGEMITLAARPRIGKTAWVLNIINEISRRGHGAVLFCGEMSIEQLTERMLSVRTLISFKRIRDRFLNGNEKQIIMGVREDMSKANVYLDDRNDLTIEHIRAASRLFVQEKQVEIVFIDYLQLIRATDKRIRREEQVAHISKSIKAMAMELKVPVMVLAQLNRDCVKEHRKPRLSDLRESGSIEQDSDVVIFLHRDDENTEDDPVIDVIFAKQRNAPEGTEKLIFNKQCVKFNNYKQEDPDQW